MGGVGNFFLITKLGMGNENLKQSSFLGKIMCCDCLKSEFQTEELRGFAQQYLTIKNSLDPYFGDCYALESIDAGKLFTLLKENVTNEQRLARAVQLSQLKKSSDGPANQNIIFTDIVASIERSGCLKNTHELYILHDHIESDLLKQFQLRLAGNQDFSQNEIKAIMKSCTKGFTRLEQQPYNSVRMQHIYFCGSGKDIKVAHPKLFHHYSNLSIVEDNISAAQIKHIYLSPEEISALQRNESKFQGGWSSNAFSFGMVVLSLMAMRHLDWIYNYQSCEVDHNEIDGLFHKVHSKYSFPLISMVQDLLKASPGPRLSFRELLIRIQGTEPANQFINELVVNLFGKNENKEQQEEEEETETKDIVLQRKNVKFPNYIAAYLKPSIGLAGQYARLNEEEPIMTRHATESVVANQRLRYTDQSQARPSMASYIGQTITIDKNKKEPMREGKGLYQHQDGQTYIGDWHKGKMHGFGKLYFASKELRYEGEFQNGLFHGSGVEYSDIQMREREEEIDEEYVKIFRGNWIRYEGHYEKDKRSGAGKIFFRKGNWRGNFKNGQPNGEGIYTNYRSQKQTKGKWIDGQLCHNS